jgi:hypothetical protein
MRGGITGFAAAGANAPERPRHHTVGSSLSLAPDARRPRSTRRRARPSPRRSTSEEIQMKPGPKTGSRASSRIGAAVVALVLLALTAAPVYAGGGGRYRYVRRQPRRVIVTPYYTRTFRPARFVTTRRITHVHRVWLSPSRSRFITHYGPFSTRCAPASVYFSPGPTYVYRPSYPVYAFPRC